MIKLAIFATHPVQYHVPLWRDLSKRKDLDVTVHYFSDHSIRGGLDKEFNRAVTWDVDLLKGYKSVFVSRDADMTKPLSMKIPDPKGLLEKGGFDCVLLQGYTHAFEMQVLRQAVRQRIEVVMRGEFADQNSRGQAKAWVRESFLKWFYRRISFFAVIGENARQHLARHGVGEDRMVHSPYAVDSGLFEAQKKKFSRAACRKALGLKEDDFALLFSGKLIPRKEPLLLLRAMSELSEHSNLKLILVGDGPMKEEVLRAATRHIPRKLVFQGFVNQSQLGRYYRAADMLAHPANFETWGLVVNEAMQFGLPSLVSDRVGCRLDLVKPGFTGLIFPSGNPNAMAFHLKNMMADREWTRKMGQNAEKLAEFYSIARAADGIHRAVKLALS